MKIIFLSLLFTILACGEATSRRTADNPTSSYKENIIKNSQSLRSGKWPTLSGQPTLLMAHRGEKVFLPEHTVGAYEFASIEGADFVEPDLVLTKDGHFVCFHDLTLKTGTDVSTKPEFAYKMTNYTGIIDEEGFPVNISNDWFIKDFTLLELQTLKVVQKKVGIRPQLFNNLFMIPTFEEYLNTVHHNALKLGKSIGIIPELKHPSFHNEIFNQTPYFMEEQLLKILTEYGYPLTSNSTGKCQSFLDNNATIPCGHLIIQSFEQKCLKYLNQRTSADLMMLIDIQIKLLTYEGLKEVATFAQYYSPWKELLYTGIEVQIEKEGIEYDKELIASMGGFTPPEKIVAEAHKLGMKVGIYTIYDSREPSFRGCAVQCDPENKEMELYFYFDMGVDGIFVENVPEARELRMKYQFQVVDSLGKDNNTSGSGIPRTESSLILIAIQMGLLITKFL